MRQLVIGTILAIAVTGSYAAEPAPAEPKRDPKTVCREEARRVWNDATLNEHVDLMNGDRITLSEDGRNAAWWMVGCRTGIRLERGQ